MVIPNVARQKGITVRLYAGLFVVFASVISSLFISHQASAALLPISDIPILGKPVAGVVNTVTGGVVRPVTNAVTNILPQPVSTVVKAPVNAVLQVVDPVVGPPPVAPVAESFSAPSVDTTDRQASSQPTLANTNLRPNSISQQAIDTPDTKTNPTIAKYTPLTLSGYLPAIGDMVVKFATTKDLSPFIAAAAIIGLMVIILAGLIIMIVRNSRRAVSSQEMTFVRQDLTQTSLLMTGLLAIGLVLLFYILH